MLKTIKWMTDQRVLRITSRELLLKKFSENKPLQELAFAMVISFLHNIVPAWQS